MQLKGDFHLTCDDAAGTIIDLLLQQSVRKPSGA
jgi:hypothetical protein